jgi:ABC-type sugar transport system permease subunit
VTLMLLAGLMAIPDDLYEAAALDGASRFQAGRYVTLPLLLPVIAVTSVLRMAADYRMFDLVYVVTRGGPGDATRNLSLLAYQQAFLNFHLGRACAIAVAMAVIALPAYFLLARVTRP